MTTTFHLHETELNDQFIQALKTLFKDRNLTLTVEVEEDTTAYLLSSSVNRERLLNSVKNINEENNLIEMSIEQLKQLAADA